MVKDLLKSIFWRGGILGLYHRIRNRRTLTVVMLHRVLTSEDPRWRACDPDYTLPAALLDACLTFLRRHYNIVTPQDVLAASAGDVELPHRALLVTFDDGWADTLQHALPRLQKAGIRAWVMVAAGAIGSAEAFWPEQLVSAWRQGRLSLTRLAGVADLPPPPQAASAAASWTVLREVIRHLQSLPASRRAMCLRELADAMTEAPDMPAAMMDAAGLAAWCASGSAVGAHGYSHEPLAGDADRVVDGRAAIDELVRSRQVLRELLPGSDVAKAMSFPHGRFDAVVQAAARDAGFELLMCSRPVLNRLPLRGGALLGRLALDVAALSDVGGRFRPERLAVHLFRRPHATL
jgi:peptidoglycan/xylan/chitin deacetylase (PgdA/CDA1 family)